MSSNKLNSTLALLLTASLAGTASVASAADSSSPRGAAGSSDGGQATLTFKDADANGDGKVSRQEAQQQPELSNKFSTLDKNRDGSLDRAEFAMFDTNRARQGMGGTSDSTGDFNDRGAGDRGQPGAGSMGTDTQHSGPGSGIE